MSLSGVGHEHRLSAGTVFADVILKECGKNRAARKEGLEDGSRKVAHGQLAFAWRGFSPAASVTITPSALRNLTKLFAIFLHDQAVFLR
jgi:hypothetical protein